MVSSDLAKNDAYFPDCCALKQPGNCQKLMNQSLYCVWGKIDEKILIYIKKRRQNFIIFVTILTVININQTKSD
jgi:hypothetical protein